jgi:hypothetical protein
MKPAATAQIKGVQPEIVFAKKQKQYLPLPCAVKGEYIVSRWRLSFVERLKVLVFGNLFIAMRNFNQSPFPIRPSVEEPDFLLGESQ